MQILSEIPKDHYLVKLNENELANLLGFHSIYTDNARPTIKSLITSENKVNISTIFQNALLFNSIKTSGKYNKAVAKLENMIAALKPIDLIFEATDLTQLEEK